MLNTIIHGDCLEVMKDIPDGSVDMVLCDLPYGTTQNKWDSIIPLAPLWEQYRRVAKVNAAIVLFAQTPFDKVLGASNLKMLKYEWVWEKSKATGFLNAKKCPLKAHENILVFYSKFPTYNPQKTKGKPYDKGLEKAENGHGTYGHFKEKYRKSESGDRLPRTVIYFKTPESESSRSTLHPTQKPLALCEYLIKTYTLPGETVLDNACGSGTTCLAARNLGRNYIGIEKELRYVEISRNRLSESAGETL